MSDMKIKSLIAETFLEVADALETGQYGKKPVIGFASEGSEHGEDNITRAMELAEAKGLKAVLIQGEDIHKQMEVMLDSGEIDAAVTMHYPFPIGVSTVGKVITPGIGKPMYIATTTGTSDTDRVCGMVKNAIYGIIAAKADGVEHPTVGIANIDGARPTEKALLKLKEQGYEIAYTEDVQSADMESTFRTYCEDGYDFIIDATDNFKTKFLINDVCVALGKPFSYGGVLRFGGQTLTHLPSTPCLRCLYVDEPPEGTVPRNEDAGVLGSVVGILGTIQATEAIKYFTGAGSLLTGRLLSFDALTMEFRTLSISANPSCRACAHK